MGALYAWTTIFFRSCTAIRSCSGSAYERNESTNDARADETRGFGNNGASINLAQNELSSFHPKTPENIKQCSKTPQDVQKYPKTSRNTKKMFQKNWKFRKKSKPLHLFLDASRCIRTHPDASEQVRTDPNMPENLKKLAETSKNSRTFRKKLRNEISLECRR